ncbi:MAG: response regulator [Parachlamydiaceae bacterium]|nr:response regulator [Parachlamydiaceae bacterium]
MKSNILIVDDEVDTPMLFEQVFKHEIKNLQIKLFFVESAEHALEILHENIIKIHLIIILSDINLSGLSGIFLLKKLKKDYPLIPVCMIAIDGANELQVAHEYLSVEIINKPINFAKLKDAISRMLKFNKLRDTGSDND